MPAPATPVDQLPDDQRAVLADISNVSAELRTASERVRELTAERHVLFARAHEAGIAQSTIARVAGVSDVAVKKALDARSGAG